MIQSVAFLGLGAMGYRMASHLPRYFSDVRVWNRTFSKAEQHAQHYQTTASSLDHALKADIIFSCLPTSKDVEQLITQALEQHQLNANTIWVDCTSGVPETAIALQQRLKAHHIDFLDAPVSGQTVGAENATLTVMVGGDEQAFQRAYPAMQAFGKLIQHVGSSGSGFAVKAVNNMLMAVNLCAVIEGFSTLKAHNIDLQSALNCINASSGQSLVSQNIFPQRILNREFPLTFALPLLNKDTGIALDLAQDAMLSTPILALARNILAIAHQQSTSEDDFSTLAKLYEEWNKLTLK